MKNFKIIIAAFAFTLSGANSICRAQGKVKQGPAAAAVRDADLETDSMKNLQAIRLYFELRKAYRASLSRCEETLAANPNFSKIDEVLYFAGESSLRLSRGEGKQKPSLKPEQYRDDARRYFEQLIKEHPDSKYRKEAEAALKELGGAAAKQ